MSPTSRVAGATRNSDKSDPVEATACRPTPHSNKLILKIKQVGTYCRISIDTIIHIIYSPIIPFFYL